jgi:DNA-binding CsgD family transcriptional regulator/tetratricopeptide (TPR) repeat protein
MLLNVSVPRGPARGDGLIGRRRELDVLRGRLAEAREGAGRLVLCVGEPGIGKTRLAQELAGGALAVGAAVAWGRCVEADGAPAFWPWRQALRSLAVDPDVVLGGDVESPPDRFRVFDAVADTLRDAAGPGGLLVVLDDVHWGDEPSLLLLRHLADGLETARLLVLATFRDVGPAGPLPRLLPDLLRAPAVDRIELRGFDLAEVREQLERVTEGSADARAVLDLTGGNPLFVREIGRAVADGTWRPDRPPRTVLDVVAARLDRVGPDCRRLVQAAAIVGRDFALPLVAAVLDEPAAACLPALDEAVAHGLLDRVGGGEHRFVHALTRDAVEASLSSADRAVLHRRVADAIETRFGADLSEHLMDLARHWAALAPLGEAATARGWAVRAAADAVRRLAYEEGVRLYRAALALDPATVPAPERARLHVGLGRAAYFAGDVRGCADAAVAAADAARAAGSAELLGEAALVLEAVADPDINAVARELCEQALAALGAGAAPERPTEALRARLLAQRSHLAFYDGEQERLDRLSGGALDLARSSGDDRALIEALRARQEACPGPAGRPERLSLAAEMLAAGGRVGSARAAMWGELWRFDALVECGRLLAAAERLAPLRLAVERVGGPVTAWHLDRVTACLAQAQGRYDDAAEAAARGFAGMRAVEPGPARGTFFALHCALAAHVGVRPEAAGFVEQAFVPLPRFRSMGPVSRAFLLLRAGRPDEAAASLRAAGPPESWSPPAFFVLPVHVFASLVCIELDRLDLLGVLLPTLDRNRGEHVSGNGVFYLGPVELTLGRARAALGDLDAAVALLGVAVERAEGAGAPGFAAEASFHLASTLLRRAGPGDRAAAEKAAAAAEAGVRGLGMAAYTAPVAALRSRLGGAEPGAGPLSPREAEVAALVAEGMTNRQIGARLVISERTAQNHVQHILTKLGFATRSQIAAWCVRKAE